MVDGPNVPSVPVLTPGDPNDRVLGDGNQGRCRLADNGGRDRSGGSRHHAGDNRPNCRRGGGDRIRGFLSLVPNLAKRQYGGTTNRVAKKLGLIVELFCSCVSAGYDWNETLAKLQGRFSDDEVAYALKEFRRTNPEWFAGFRTNDPGFSRWLASNP